MRSVSPTPRKHYPGGARLRDLKVASEDSQILTEIVRREIGLIRTVTKLMADFQRKQLKLNSYKIHKIQKRER